MSSKVTEPQNGDLVDLNAFDIEVTPSSLTFGTETDPVPIEETLRE